jgi:hypothetical protein
MDIATPQGKDSADDYFFNPLSMHAVYASVWNISSTFLYCRPVTILEWNAEYFIILSPVVIPESIIFHLIPPPRYELYVKRYPLSADQELI